MKWRTLVLVAVVGLLMIAILPAQAGHVEAVRVNGNASCASVDSTGHFSFKIEPVTFGPHTDPATGVVVHISESFSEGEAAAPNTFNFSIEGGEVHDAIVKGSAANHYDYTAGEGSPVTDDWDLTIPNGNKLNYAIFCYEAEGQSMDCGVPRETSEGGTSAIFTRESGDCEVDKSAVLDIQGEEILFIPQGQGSATYTGDLTFTKQHDDPELLVLQYDPDDAGPLGFRPVPACQDASLTEDSIPVGNGDTWCYYGVEASPFGGDSEISALAAGDWEVNWSVFGIGDPRFK